LTRFLLAAFSPQLSSSVPTVRPNLVQGTPSLRLSSTRYYLALITLSTKKPSWRGLVLCNEKIISFTRQASLLEWISIPILTLCEMYFVYVFCFSCLYLVACFIVFNEPQELMPEFKVGNVSLLVKPLLISFPKGRIGHSFIKRRLHFVRVHHYLINQLTSLVYEGTNALSRTKIMQQNQ